MKRASEAMVHDIEVYKEILEMQNAILEKVAEDAAQQEVLDALCRLQERIAPGSLAAFMLFKPDGTSLRVEAAPSLDAGALTLFETAVAGAAGMVGAMQSAMPLLDVMTDDPRWEALRKETGRCFKACWTMPVFLEGKVAGSFILTSCEADGPTDFHKLLLNVGARIVSIVLERERHRKTLSYLAFHDPLTGLGNRTLFEERLQALMARPKAAAALLFIDLDRFKYLNDTFGHETGDLLLVEVAKRLRDVVGSSDTIARFGGDEFLLLLENESDRSAIRARTQAVKAIFKEPFVINDRSFRIAGSIGIALYPEDGTNAQSLLKHADTAVHQAKRAQEHFRFYLPQMSEQTRKSFELEKELHDAIRREEFVVFYQPVFKGKNQELIGAEALVRWQHPQRGLLFPAEFIGCAEETGLISQVDEMVFEQVISDLRRWHMEPINRIVPISVNISGRHVNEKDVTQLTYILNRSALARDYISLELTESYLMQFAEETMVQLERLKHTGVRLAMDDFGSGYSSLGYLKRFKIDTLKIDQLLVRDIVENSEDRSITEAIIKMGHSLGLQVIAEGVETEAQLGILHTLGCDAVQGFYFDRALPAPFFEEKYLRRKR